MASLQKIALTSFITCSVLTLLLIICIIMYISPMSRILKKQHLFYTSLYNLLQLAYITN